MNILSEYPAEEYLLSLRTYDALPQHSTFSELLKKEFKTFRTTSVISATRNIIFEFKLKDESYVLKHFLDKPVRSNKNLLEEDTFEQISHSYFNTEKEVLQNKLNYLPKIYFYDSQSHTIIMEKLLGYQNFYDFLLQNLSNPTTLKQYLKNLAETLKSITKNSINSLSQSNSKNILMIGELKSHEELFKYYKKYCDYWDESGLIHADLFARNILVNTDKENIKIIDWEMATLGDPYFDLSTVVSILCDRRLGIFFPNVHYSKRAYDFAMLRKDIDYFLDAYMPRIDKQRLKTFLIINTQDRCKNSDEVSNLIKNINQIFP